MIGFYRKFIPSFSEIARPLTQLTRKNAHFHWSETCQGAFETLREKLTESPILAYPRVDLPYLLHTDASQYAVSGILSQSWEEGNRVVQFLSHQLTLAQQKWPCIERAGYAVV